MFTEECSLAYDFKLTSTKLWCFQTSWSRTRQRRRRLLEDSTTCDRLFVCSLFVWLVTLHLVLVCFSILVGCFCFPSFFVLLQNLLLQWICSSPNFRNWPWLGQSSQMVHKRAWFYLSVISPKFCNNTPFTFALLSLVPCLKFSNPPSSWEQWPLCSWLCGITTAGLSHCS